MPIPNDDRLRPTALRLALALVLVVACGGGTASSRDVRGPECATDADCVPATCCHPTRCVPRSVAPRCDGVVCTRECAPGSLDCGGRCACRGGACVAELRAAPERDVLPAR